MKDKLNISVDQWLCELDKKLLGEKGLTTWEIVDKTGRGRSWVDRQLAKAIADGSIKVGFRDIIKRDNTHGKVPVYIYEGNGK